jgi:hypothetical protein
MIGTRQEDRAMPSIATLANVKDRVPVELTDAALQALIDRIESRLTRLVGAPDDTPREDAFYGVGDGLIALIRPPASVEAVFTGTTVDPLVDTPLAATDWRLSGANLERLPYGYCWYDVVVVQWTPIDITDDWIEAVIDLVRLRTARTAHTSERIGEWSYSGADFEAAEQEVIARLAQNGIVG